MSGTVVQWSRRCLHGVHADEPVSTPGHPVICFFVLLFFLSNLCFSIVFFFFWPVSLYSYCCLFTALRGFCDNVFLVTWFLVWFTYSAFMLFYWLFEKLIDWQFGFVLNCLSMIACCLSLRGRLLPWLCCCCHRVVWRLQKKS